jgi:hypothetical protein
VRRPWNPWRLFLAKFCSRKKLQKNCSGLTNGKFTTNIETLKEYFTESTFNGFKDWPEEDDPKKCVYTTRGNLGIFSWDSLT